VSGELAPLEWIRRAVRLRQIELSDLSVISDSVENHAD